MSPRTKSSLSLVEFSQDVHFDQSVIELFNHAERENFEFGEAWLRNLVVHGLEQHEHAYLGVLNRGDKAVAVLPILRSVRTRRVRALSTFYTSCYSPVFHADLDHSDLVKLCGELKKQLDTGVIQLAPLEKKSSTYESLLLAMKQAGWFVFPYFCFGNWYLPLRWANYEAYFLERPSKVKNTVVRRKRKFYKAQRGRIVLYRDSEALNQAIRDYQTIYTQSWKVEEPFAEFMPGLIRLAAKQGWLRLGVAYYDDTPVAAQLWIVAHGRASIFKLAYDEAYKKLSAGTILTDFLMKHVIDVDKVSEIDYLIGDDGYKKEWMSHRKERWGLVAFNPYKLDGLVGVINEGARKCIKYMFSRRRKQRAQ